MNCLTNIYYKILTQARFSYIEGEFKVKYEVDKMVFSHDTPARFGFGLFVFDTCDHAYAFSGAFGVIWEVKGYDEYRSLPNNLGVWPAGTIMVQGVQLIKKIKR